MNCGTALEKFKLAVLKELSQAFAEEADVNVSTMVDFERDAIMACVTQQVWGQRLGDEVRVVYLADWWQALKKRWFPRWARNRWPVRYAETVIDVVELYPKWRPPDTEHVKLARVLARGSARIEGIDADHP
jgi:hypothetical protein